MAKKKGKQKQSAFRKYIRVLWGIFLLGVTGIIVLFGGAALGIFGPMPDLQQLENPRTNLATQIISSDGTILGKYYFDDNRTPIGFDEIPTDMVEALIATEDERFYEHAGIDWRGTLRAFVFLGKRGGPVPSPNSWHVRFLWVSVPEMFLKPFSKKHKNGSSPYNWNNAIPKKKLWRCI